jgi:ribosomal protein L7/L12
MLHSIQRRLISSNNVLPQSNIVNLMTLSLSTHPTGVMMTKMTSSRSLHMSAAYTMGAANPGPVEKNLRAEAAASKPPANMDLNVLNPNATAAGGKVYSAKIKRLADEIANLTMLESMDLTDALRDKLGLSKSDLLFPGGAIGAGGGGGAASAPAASTGAAAAAAPKEEAAAAAAPKEEKTHVSFFSLIRIK